MNGNKIIVHTLIKSNEKYLVTKRSRQETTYPEYWDIPGGLADYGELPKDAVIRETKEEVRLNIIPTKIIHEDSRQPQCPEDKESAIVEALKHFKMNS